MTVSEYIWKTLADWGTDHVFLVTGGGAMYLNDALGREKRIKYICNLHEQACAMAAEGYARISGKPGIINVTTGPGGTNALTGVLGAWLDSIPMIIISGQIKRSTMITSCPNLRLRLLGDLEFNIIDAVKPMTKYAKTIMDINEVPRILEEAWTLTISGRPGPVWIDIPLDIQSAECNFQNILIPKIINLSNYLLSHNDVNDVIQLLKKSRRPAIIVGYGIHNAKAEDDFKLLSNILKIPVLTSISGIDLITSDHPYFFGRPGILGDRSANLIMQNSDLFLVLGTRMGLRISGYSYDTIAREAIKIMVDIDQNELDKPTFKPNIKINCDVGEFIRYLILNIGTIEEKQLWISYCNKMKSKYPIITEEHRNRQDYVSSYVLPEKISKYADDDSIIVTSNGVAYTSTFLSIPIKKQMRMFSNEGCASMGYGLPAAIGAWFASKRQVICFEGDGSILMNLLELQTLVTYDIPLKLFIYNNDGYLSIKTTQKTFFKGIFTGAEPNSGVKLPSFEKIAEAYHIKYTKLSNNQELDYKLSQIFSRNELEIIEVILDPFEKLGPKAASKKLSDGTMVSAPLEDMAPFLSREEFLDNMIIKPIKDNF